MNPLHSVVMKACSLVLITVGCGDGGSFSNAVQDSAISNVGGDGGRPTAVDDTPAAGHNRAETVATDGVPTGFTPPSAPTPSSDSSAGAQSPTNDSHHDLDAGADQGMTDATSSSLLEHFEAGASDESSQPAQVTAADAGAEFRTDAGNGEITARIEWQETDHRVGVVRVEASTLTVPVDYSQPSGEQLSIALARLRTRSASRAGVLLWNPGGPGASVLADVEGNATLLSSLFPNMDIILMDNRGTGQSAPLECLVADAAESAGSNDGDAGGRADASIETPIEGDASIEAQVEDGARRTREILAACGQAFPTRLAHFNTENVARDMEQLRLALGEEQLNYWGVSYGTLQGALYAAMFPHGVGAWVLDSPVYRQDYQAPDLVAQIVSGTDAYEAQLLRFFDHCDQSRQCLVSQGPGQAEQAYIAARVKLETGGTFLDVPLYPDYLYATTELLLSAGRWDLLEQVLADGLSDDWYLMLALLLDNLPEDDQDALNESVSNRVILGIDYGCPDDYDLQAALSVAAELTNDHAHLGPWNAARAGWCAGWDLVREQAVVTPSNVKTPPFVIMAGLHDPATTYGEALALQEQLGNDSTLLTSHAEGHGAALATDCATAALIEYIESGDLSVVPDTCQVASPQSSPLLEVKRQAAAALRAKLRTKLRRPWH